jgi:phage minor structural protein
MIKSFPKNATVFTSNGQRVIQPLFCKEHREIGDWYIELSAPLEFQPYLEHDMILVVPTKEKGNQPFRIKNPKVTSKVEVKAFHIGFDSANHAVELSTVINANCQTALTTLLTNTEDTTNFTVYSDITTLKTFSVVNVSLYDALRQIADEYNGILDFDGWQIRITANIGADNGVVLAYGKNIQESEITENWDLVVTKLKPIGNDGILLTPEWLTADVSYDRPYTKIMNFDTDSISNLGLVAQLYLDRFKVPRVNYKVKAKFRKTLSGHEYLALFTHDELGLFTHEELKEIEENIKLSIGDAIYVRARQFETTTEVISYDYNVITKMVDTVEFGNFRPTLKNFFSEITQQAEERAVKKAQLKIDEVNGTIEAVADDLTIQIGDRVPILTHNYVLNSNFAADFANWANNGTGTGTRTIETISSKKYFRLETTNTTNSFYGIIQNITPYQHGEQITYSIVCRRNSGDGRLRFRVENIGDGNQNPIIDNYITPSSSFQRYSFTFDSSSVTAKTTYKLFLVMETNKVAQIDMSDVQLEVGTSATDYILNPAEIPNTKYVFTKEGANFYSDAFKIYNALNVLKAYFDNVNDHLNLGVSVGMQKVQPADIAELVQFNRGKYGIKFGDDRNLDGFPFAFLSVFDSGNLAELTQAFNVVLYANNSVELRSDGDGDGTGFIKLTAADYIQFIGTVKMGGIVHMSFGESTYLITRDSNGFLKATTTV